MSFGPTKHGYPHMNQRHHPRLAEVFSVGVGKTSVQLSGKDEDRGFFTPSTHVVPEQYVGWLFSRYDSWGLCLHNSYIPTIFRDFPYRGYVGKKGYIQLLILWDS